MRNLLENLRHIISWIATPLIAMCPLCIFTAAFIAIGQVSFLFALARVLTPILIGLISISILSFYLSYRSHKNIYPLILSILGGTSVTYTNIAYGVSILFLVTGILFLSSAALIDLNLRLSRRENCEACLGKSKSHSH